jgi:hypothetical protein
VENKRRLAALALMIDSLPQKVLKWFKEKQQTPGIGQSPEKE